MSEPLPLIHGISCPSCGRNNSEAEQLICTSDDCPGVRLYNAAPELLAQCKKFLYCFESAVKGGHPGEITQTDEGIDDLRKAITKAEKSLC